MAMAGKEQEKEEPSATTTSLPPDQEGQEGVTGDKMSYAVLFEYLSDREGFVSTTSSSKAYLEIFKRVTSIASNGSPEKLSPVFYRLIARLLSRIQCPRLELSAEKKFFRLLRSISKESVDEMAKLMFSENNLVALSLVVRFIHENGTSSEILGFNGVPTKAQILESFVKECYMTKVAKSVWFVNKISQNVFPIVNEEDCKSTIIPGIQKGMLRSPEITTEAIAHSLKWIPVDLSPFAAELSKPLGSYFHSKEDASREQAIAASLTLADRMNIAGIIKVATWYIDVYNGAEGKLSIAANKIDILKTVEEMGVVAQEKSKGKQLDDTSIITCGVKILESEVHEGTVVQGIKMVQAWTWICNDISHKDLANYFSKSFSNLKGNARTAACTLLDRPNVIGLDSNDKLKCFCIKTYEKSYSQILQSNGLLECIWLARFMLEKRLVTVTDTSTYESFWSLINHINEKFLATCPNDTFYQSGIMLKQLFCSEIPQQYNVETATDTLGILLSVKDYKTREQLVLLLAECINNNNNIAIEKVKRIPIGLFKAFSQDIVPAKLRTAILLKFLRNINDKFKNVHGQDFLLDCLPVAYCCPEQDTWIRAIQGFGHDPAEFTMKFENQLLSYITSFDGSELHRAIVKSLAFIGGERMISNITEEFNSTVNDPDLMKISRDDYFIFLTPDNQLYDTSVIDACDESTKNMKRESRVYSYKEQLEEIQLKKELEEKRRQSGKPIQYTPKQKEAIKVQMAKEKAIREHVAKLHKLVIKGIGLIESAWEGNSIIFGMYMKECISKLVQLMNSPLAAPDTVAFFIKMGKSLFQPEILGEAVGQMSLRLINPTCDIAQRWQTITLSAGVGGVLDSMLTEIQKDDEMSGAKFAYSFPLLRLSLTRFPNDAKISTTVLQIILTVAKDGPGTIRGKVTFIPRYEVLDLLYKIVGTKDGTMQQLAVSSIMQFTKVVVGNSTNMEIITDAEIYLHLSALSEPSRHSREIGIRCLNILSPLLSSASRTFSGKFTNDELISSIYREQFDSYSEIVALAEDTWKKAGFQLTKGLHRGLYDSVSHPCDEVRHSASKALAAFLKQHPDMIEGTIGDLINSYKEYDIPTPPLLDNLGRVLQEEIDRWEARCGVGLAIREIATEMSPPSANLAMEWLVTIALSDRSPAVHNIMLEAAVEIVKLHGTECLNEFINIIETFLEKVGKAGRYDNLRQACVVLMGCLARHLNPSDSRVKSIFTTLIETLSTPSEKVQESVANCLPALVPAISSDSEAVLKRLLEKVMEADNFGERRGAAYGIAGMIKGLGILSLKQHDIMNILAKGMQDKKNFKHREGSLMCLELLCEFLGRLFEPYIVHVLPYLLQCLGDSNVYVREATENTAKRVMSRLSAHGVKLVLPSLIGALNEDSWRTKCGSVELLGRMAYCAPKQLSGCLPMIVPRLIEVLGDSHVKVQDAGAKALGLIGSVIQNPEIQSVVPVLLEALQDPGKRSSSCLQCLLQTEFVHFVDPPSLALIMPVVQRAFLDRSTENRKMACQVIGNMYSLTDHSDLAPYMDNVMPGIQASLLDPVPEVRAVAAKALGSMAKGMGEKCYDEILPWLMKTLVSDVNSVDRSGAAQGLAEVIGALGVDKLHRFMPEIIKKADSDDLAPHVRDGYMMMFIYMPSVFETEFVIYIGQIINPILKALADENEFVRETALKAGQRIVTGFADTAITLLLPELERGIFDDNWRIRYSSIQLLGDLLYKISGVSGKMSTESAGDDDNFGTEQSQQTIIMSLGLERRNRVLAGLYMGRSDVALMVRQAALHVWKVVVANTPKTLREILPTLFSLLLGCLASSSHDKHQVAARTLGDLVRKLGEKILPEIIPILERGLDSTRADERQGVCIGLSEIMAATSREMVLAFLDNLVPTLRKALCDTSPLVREAAAKTFGSLHSTVGSRTLDEIIPYLMRKLNNPVEGEYALDGLRQILIVKSKSVMPYLIPQLTAPPVNTKALSVLASVAGESLSRHLGKILPALLVVLTESFGTPKEEEELANCESIILNVVDEQGVRMLIDELLDHIKTDKEEFRRATVTLLSIFCIHTKADIEPYMPQLIRGLFQLMTDTDEIILNLVADGLNGIVKGLESAEKLAYVGDVRQAIRFVQSDLKGKTTLPGLCTSKGISPVLPIFREALLNGRPDVKEQAAIGMGELIVLSTDVALKPSVIHITGPLIRILGDRYGPDVKIAVLDTLTLLLKKVGIHLKAFHPQLQITFVKASNDPNGTVRLKAEYALAQLKESIVIKK